MRLVSGLLWVLVLAVSPIVGCTEVTDPNTLPLTLAVSGRDTEDGPRVPLEGAQLCQTATINCALSDSRGRVTIHLPIGEESSFTLEMEGYASYLVPIVLTAEVAEEFGMASDRLMVARHEGATCQYPMIETGSILVSFVTSAFAGATFDLVDATGKPYYVDEEGNWRPDLTATTSRGSGGFCEVPPGNEFEIELGGTAEDCHPSWAWPSEAENAVRFPVEENYLTYLSVSCPPPP